MPDIEQEDTLQDILSHQAYYIEMELGCGRATLLMEQIQDD